MLLADLGGRMRSFPALWALAFITMMAGSLFELLMSPDLSEGALSFKPDSSRVADLIDGPGRVLGHAPVLFFVNALLLSALFAVIFSREADK